jgi:hypothetical protein
MIQTGTPTQNALDPRGSKALATQTVTSPVGSSQALDHRREATVLERWRRASDPLLLWPVLAALTQLLVL